MKETTQREKNGKRKRRSGHWKLLTVCVLTALCLAGCKKRQEDIFLPEEYGMESAAAAEASASNSETGQTSGGPGEAGQEAAQETAFCYIHICGQVRTPGVYKLAAGSRVCDAVREAGGFTENADEDYVNQAAAVEDGMKIVVPSFEEAASSREAASLKEAGEGGGQTYGVFSAQETEEKGGQVNINTASAEKLCTLPGIGESRAQSIIRYREKNGGFQDVTEIMQVEGIKEGAFAKLDGLICVR